MKAWELAVPLSVGSAAWRGGSGGWAGVLAGVEGGGLAVYVTQGRVEQGLAG